MRLKIFEINCKIISTLFIRLFLNICLSKVYAATVDVIVVGGGLSALTTAYRLSQAGLKVKVFDGDETLGGHTRSRFIMEILFLLEEHGLYSKIHSLFN
jgi:ribulose 1,5-bisphosphate synthetase/thiazole synthase